MQVCVWCNKDVEQVNGSGFCPACVADHVEAFISEINDATIEADKPEKKKDTDPSTLKRVKSDIPIVAYKAATVHLRFNSYIRDRDGFFKTTGAYFTAVTGTGYQADEKAICNVGHKHYEQIIPVVNCSCGFYSWKSIESLDVYTQSAKLKVELLGKVIDCSKGYRAERQRVMSVDFSHTCYLCADLASTLVITNIYTVEPICAKDLIKYNITHKPISTSDLSGLLGAEVVWTPTLIQNKTSARFKSIAPLWAAILIILVLWLTGVASQTSAYILAFVISAVHIPYNATLYKKSKQQYFNPIVQKKNKGKK